MPDIDALSLPGDPDFPSEAFSVGRDGDLVEQRWLGDEPYYLHHVDLPRSDVTVHRGIPVTTPIRTVIDIACDTEPDQLDAVIGDCLGRGLFTVEEAWHRLGQPDMARRHGAELVREALRRRGLG
ncbi:MAG TPA: hypothetical protein PKA98_05345 [Acidimicrobiales bacterium]|nr:hypothetical protein [Acidimicrobiales bacterium]